MAKSVRVHDDTHTALMQLKTRRRSPSLDQVIRDMIREATGVSVEEARGPDRTDELTRYFEG